MIARITLDIELDDVTADGPIPVDAQRRDAEKIAEGVADSIEGTIVQVALLPSPVDA